jgi:hypothetical protein
MTPAVAHPLLIRPASGRRPVALQRIRGDLQEGKRILGLLVVDVEEWIDELCFRRVDGHFVQGRAELGPGITGPVARPVQGAVRL